MSHFFLVLVLLLCIDAFTQEHSKLSDYDVRHMFIVKILIESLPLNEDDMQNLCYYLLHDRK